MNKIYFIFFINVIINIILENESINFISFTNINISSSNIHKNQFKLIITFLKKNPNNLDEERKILTEQINEIKRILLFYSKKIILRINNKKMRIMINQIN